MGELGKAWLRGVVGVTVKDWSRGVVGVTVPVTGGGGNYPAWPLCWPLVSF